MSKSLTPNIFLLSNQMLPDPQPDPRHLDHLAQNVISLRTGKPISLLELLFRSMYQHILYF